MKIDPHERATFWAAAVQRASAALDDWRDHHGPRLASFGEKSLAQAAIGRAESWLTVCLKQRDGWHAVIAQNTEV